MDEADKPVFGSIRPHSVWCWEPLKPHVTTTISVVGTWQEPETGEWWVEAETVATGARHRSKLSRFVEACVLVKAAE